MASSSADSDLCLGSASSGRVGTVVEYDGSDLPYKVQFNGDDCWYTQEQLVLASSTAPAPEAAIKVGSRVRVRPGVSPSTGWGGVKPESVGTVTALQSDGVHCVVDFPEHSSWNGVISEMMLMQTEHGSFRRFVVGDRVKASSSADSGKCLGSASNGRVGVVVKDDSTDLPFQVECNGNDNWYTQTQLVLVSAAPDTPVRIYCGFLSYSFS